MASDRKHAVFGSMFIQTLFIILIKEVGLLSIADSSLTPYMSAEDL